MRGLGVFLFIVLTFCCWGLYGPVLHLGQEAMGTTSGGLSTLRPFVCVGVAYFLVAVLYPLTAIRTLGEAGQWSGKGIVYSLLAGMIGALGALGIMIAFKLGGKPVYVMPLVFGLAPIVNTLVTMLVAGTVRKVSPAFFLGTILVAFGAAGVLWFKPAPRPIEDAKGTLEAAAVWQQRFVNRPLRQVAWQPQQPNANPPKKELEQEPEAEPKPGRIDPQKPIEPAEIQLPAEPVIQNNQLQQMIEAEGGNAAPRIDGREPGRRNPNRVIPEPNKPLAVDLADPEDVAEPEPVLDDPNPVFAEDRDQGVVDVQPVPPPPNQDQNPASLLTRLAIGICIGLTALCWGAYGPILHLGQSSMSGSRLRPFLCVGIAYFAVAVIVPGLMLGSGFVPDAGQWNFWGTGWSLLAGFVGAIGAMGVIYAFHFGGKPILVMPLIFGFAPVVNTLTESIFKGILSDIEPAFLASLLLVIAGAVMVLVFSPQRNTLSRD